MQEIIRVEAPECELGEGPTWLDPTAELLYVDIVNGRVHRLDPSTGAASTLEFGGQVSAALPTHDGSLVVARDLELLLVDQSGAIAARWTIDEDPEDNRLNDCRVDPAGRIWAGTMSTSRRPRQAALYRLDRRGLTQAVAPTTLSNGMGWSPDGNRMYFIDSTTQRVDQFGFDVATGSLGERQTFVEVPSQAGLPDGLTVDSDGCVWVCLFGGGAVHRYTPDGNLERVIELPVSCPTCPSFGGADLSTLYITTARHRLDASQRYAEPLAGALLSLAPDVVGRPPDAADLSITLTARTPQ